MNNRTANANKRLYVAYGSNLNLAQMAFRCPTAKVVGKGVIKDYQLIFQNVATIIPEKDSEVQVAVWEIDEVCELSLDRYEGFPSLYRKEDVEVEMYDGSKVTAMVYIMNYGTPRYPSKTYYNTILQGYNDVGLPVKSLVEAIYATERYYDTLAYIKRVK